MSITLKRLTEAERMRLIVSFLKTGTQPEGYTVREDDRGGYRVTAVKVKDPEEEKKKKKDRYIKKLLEIDPTLAYTMGLGSKETSETPDCCHSSSPYGETASEEVPI